MTVNSWARHTSTIAWTSELLSCIFQKSIRFWKQQIKSMFNFLSAYAPSSLHFKKVDGVEFASLLRIEEGSLANLTPWIYCRSIILVFIPTVWIQSSRYLITSIGSNKARIKEGQSFYLYIHIFWKFS